MIIAGHCIPRLPVFLHATLNRPGNKARLSMHLWFLKHLFGTAIAMAIDLGKKTCMFCTPRCVTCYYSIKVQCHAYILCHLCIVLVNVSIDLKDIHIWHLKVYRLNVGCNNFITLMF